MSNERTDDDSETRGQGQSEDLPKQRMPNTCSESNKRQHTNTIRYFSMFSGVGGFELGLEAANALSVAARNESRWDEKDSRSTEPVTMAPQQFTCVGQSEWDKYSSQVLRYKFPNIRNWGDCTKIKPEDLPDFDMLCGGFPCQAFSIAGKRRGFEDIRGTMFFEIARILEVKRPKTILLENVKGLLNHDKGKTFRVILQTLDELGYEVQWMVLNSKFHGVPQNRERVLIIGNIRGERRPEILPFGYIMPETLIKNEGQGILISAKTGARRTPQANCLDTMYHKGLGSNQERTAIIDVYNRKEHTDRSPSLTEPHHNTLRVREGVNIRKLTPTECCRLQGFPDDWNEFGTDDKGAVVKMSDTQRYKQMGNAVTTNVIKAVGSQILKKPSRSEE